MAFLIHFLNVFLIITYAGDLYGAANAFCCGTRLTGSIDRCLLIGELLKSDFYLPRETQSRPLFSVRIIWLTKFDLVK